MEISGWNCSWLYCFPPTILMFTLFFFFHTQFSHSRDFNQRSKLIHVRHNVILIWVTYNCLTIRVMNLTCLILRKLHNLENTCFNSTAIQNFLLAIIRNCWNGATASHNHLKGYQKARFLFCLIVSWHDLKSRTTTELTLFTFSSGVGIRLLLAVCALNCLFSPEPAS